MRTQIRTIIQRSANEAFDYLLHMKDCGAWMDQDEVQGLALLFKDGRYDGFVGPSVDVGLLPLLCEVEMIKWGEFVHYKPMVASTGIVGTTVGPFFPFKSIRQSLRTEVKGNECLVIQEVELEPNGWLVCKFLVLPSTRRAIEKSNAALNLYLSGG